MSGDRGVRKIDTMRLARADRGYGSPEVDIRVNVTSGEFTAEYAGRKFANMKLTALHAEIRDHDNNLEKLKWVPVICIRRDDYGGHGSTTVLGVSYWRMFRARRQGHLTGWRVWKGDVGGRFSELREKHLDTVEVTEPDTWERESEAQTVLPYTEDTWRGLRTLSRMEVELKAKLADIIRNKKADLVAFLLRTAEGGMPLLGTGSPR